VKFHLPLKNTHKKFHKVILKRIKGLSIPSKPKEIQNTIGMLANAQDLLFPRLSRNSLNTMNSSSSNFSTQLQI
jgi:hypothetical protein